MRLIEAYTYRLFRVEMDIPLGKRDNDTEFFETPVDLLVELRDYAHAILERIEVAAR